FQSDVVLLSAHQIDRTVPFGGGLRCEMIDDLLPINAQPDTVIGGGVEGVAAGCRSLYLAGPADGKGIWLHARVGGACAPVKIDGRVGTGEGEGSEVHVVEILALKAGAGPSATG